MWFEVAFRYTLLLHVSLGRNIHKLHFGPSGRRNLCLQSSQKSDHRTNLLYLHIYCWEVENNKNNIKYICGESVSASLKKKVSKYYCQNFDYIIRHKWRFYYIRRLSIIYNVKIFTYILEYKSKYTVKNRSRQVYFSLCSIFHKYPLITYEICSIHWFIVLKCSSKRKTSRAWERVHSNVPLDANAAPRPRWAPSRAPTT